MKVRLLDFAVRQCSNDGDPDAERRVIEPNEIQLCAELARCMLRDIVVRQPGESGLPPAFEAGARFAHGFQGYLETASLVSNRLRLTRCVEPDGSLRMSVGPSFLTELAVAPEDFEDFIQRERARLIVDIAEVLEAFTGVTAGQFGLLPVTREAFAAPDAYRAALGLLALHGYAERGDGRYRWTDRIGPAMRETFLWTPDNEDQDAVRAAELAEEAQAACAAMPDLVRARLKRAAGDSAEADFVRLVAEYWDGSAWHLQPLATPGWTFMPSRFVDFARGLRGLLLAS